MSFSFGAAKTATGFTLPTTTTSAGMTTGFQFAAGGDAKITKPAINLTFTPSTTTVTALPPAITTATTGAPPLEFSFAGTATTAPQFNLGTLGTGTTSVITSASTLFSLATTTTAPSLLNIPVPSTTTSASLTSTPSLFSLTSTVTSKPATTGAPIVSSTVTTTALSVAPVTTSVSTTVITAVPGATNTLSYSQLEDNINKWTIYLEEEGKHYANQAKQINAWDRLLIANSEKILSLNKGIEHVKHQQDQLDQELDFVLAQQKELEDLIAPLEKELQEIPVPDLDRHRTYQMAETLNTQLKQMSEDLKEIIEHLSESNKNQEMSNPIMQIGRILNVHMNSLQWVDRNTTKITSHLDQIAKMHDMNKRNHEINLQRTYE